jgi:hypothetical protein
MRIMGEKVMIKIIVRPDGTGTLIEYEESDDK